MNGQRFRNKNATLWQTTNQTKRLLLHDSSPLPSIFCNYLNSTLILFFEATRFDIPTTTLFWVKSPVKKTKVTHVIIMHLLRGISWCFTVCKNIKIFELFEFSGSISRWLYNYHMISNFNYLKTIIREIVP